MLKVFIYFFSVNKMFYVFAANAFAVQTIHFTYFILIPFRVYMCMRFSFCACQDTS